jgi:hypothetical protein
MWRFIKRMSVSKEDDFTRRCAGNLIFNNIDEGL